MSTHGSASVTLILNFFAFKPRLQLKLKLNREMSFFSSDQLHSVSPWAVIVFGFLYNDLRFHLDIPDASQRIIGIRQIVAFVVANKHLFPEFNEFD
jgi:hypothetical protein